MEKTKQTEQQDLNWLEQEEAQLKVPKNFEKLPSLVLEENKIVSFEVDFSKPFEKWNSERNGKKIVKAIIPVTHDSVRKNWWLSQNNPIFADIIHAGRAGQKSFKIITTGKQEKTRYSFVKE